MMAGLMGAGHNAAAVQAFNEGTIGFGLSGGGFVIFYLVGVVEALVKLGIIVPGESKTAGASAGALTTVAMCSRLTPDQLKETVTAVARACTRQGHCAGSLGYEVRKALDANLPPGSYKSCSGTGYISMSVGDIKRPTGLLVGNYSSDDDLKAAAIATSYIPLWSGPGIATEFRGQPALDGYLTDNLPCPKGVSYCVRVSLDPYDYPTNTIPQYMMYATVVLKDHDTSRRYDKPLPPISPRNKTDLEQAAAVAADAGVALQPNLFSKLPFSKDEWELMKFIPASPATQEYMMKLGYHDAKLWAERSGLAQAAYAKKLNQHRGRKLKAARAS
jgi:hypothetical protein